MNAIDEALTQALTSGPVAASTVKAALMAAGHGDKAIRAARARLSVIVDRTGFGATTRTIWSLPTLAPLDSAFTSTDSAFASADSAFASTAGAFASAAGPEGMKAKVERLTLALAEARQKIADQEAALALARDKAAARMTWADRRLLAVLARATGWSTSLDVTMQRLDGLRDPASVLRRLNALAERGLIEAQESGKASRHGTPVRSYRLLQAGRNELIGF